MRLMVLSGMAASVLLISACEQKPADPAPSASATTDETPENAPGITLFDGVVQLPAASGRPGVAYFTLAQGDGAPRKLVAVHVDGFGRAEMHESKMANGVATMSPVTEVAIDAGKTVEFKPGGYHVMLFDPEGSLAAGATTEVTITLDNGDKASTPARVQTIGGGGGMDHM
ncbi:MAG: hypothetical protein B7Z39_00515 [Novosphingobium sp. 12-64-8]|nr:MAG: hypothetical protein B7Z39_00515 [Novosphingobium sp. 12-64-8]